MYLEQDWMESIPFDTTILAQINWKSLHRLCTFVEKCGKVYTATGASVVSMRARAL